jgi:hypothetical protein
MPEVFCMARRSAILLSLVITLMAALAACGGSAATNTPVPPTPTVAPPTATPTVAPTAPPTAAPATATRVAGSATTSTTAASTTTTGTRTAGTSTTGTTAAGSTTAGTGLTTYTDPQGRFSFSHPAAWLQETGSAQNVVVQFTGTNPILSVNVVVGPLPPNITPDQYLPRALDQIKQTIPDMAVVGSTPLQVGGEQGIQIDYTGTVNSNKLYFSQIFVGHKTNAYALTLVCQPADIDRAKQQAIVVIQTWKFLT